MVIFGHSSHHTQHNTQGNDTSGLGFGLFAPDAVIIQYKCRHQSWRLFIALGRMRRHRVEDAEDTHMQASQQARTNAHAKIQ